MTLVKVAGIEQCKHGNGSANCAAKIEIKEKVYG